MEEGNPTFTGLPEGFTDYLETQRVTHGDTRPAHEIADEFYAPVCTVPISMNGVGPRCNCAAHHTRYGETWICPIHGFVGAKQ